MSKWRDIPGKVVSARVTENVYTLLQDRARTKGLSLGAYVSQVLSNGITKPYTPTIPLYNEAIHKAGDTVMVRRGKTLIEAVVPELDGDGHVVPVL